VPRSFHIQSQHAAATDRKHAVKFLDPLGSSATPCASWLPLQPFGSAHRLSEGLIELHSVKIFPAAATPEPARSNFLKKEKKSSRSKTTSIQDSKPNRCTRSHLHRVGEPDPTAACAAQGRTIAASDLCSVVQSYEYLRPDLLVHPKEGHLLVVREVAWTVQNGS
jgi:hypothetical protein